MEFDNDGFETPRDVRESTSDRKFDGSDASAETPSNDNMVQAIRNMYFGLDQVMKMLKKDEKNWFFLWFLKNYFPICHVFRILNFVISRQFPDKNKFY